jgi:ATP-binding cassette, subfamily B, bacterial
VSLVSWTLSFLRPYRARVVLLGLIAAIDIGLGVLAPWPLKLVVDNVLGHQPLPSALAWLGQLSGGDGRVALLLVIVIGGALLQVLTQFMSMINTQVQVDTGQRMVYSLRSRLLTHLQALALRHHIVSRTADSVYRLETDAYCVHDLVMSGMLPLVTSTLTLAAMFVVLLRLDWQLALLSLTIIPLLYVCLRYYSMRMVDRAERVKELESKLLITLIDDRIS